MTYVAIAVVLAVIAMMIFMDNWIIPFVFLASIAVAILVNMGSNYFMGEAFIHYQSVGGSPSACGNNGLLNLPVAQL